MTMAIVLNKSVLAGLALLSGANCFSRQIPVTPTTALNMYQASFQWDGMTEGNMVRVEGSTLRTCSFPDAVDDVKLNLQSQGRPIFADVELWQTPTYVPWKCRVWSEDGRTFPLNCVIHTPKGANAIQVKNTANVAMPLDAAVQIDDIAGMDEIADRMMEAMPPKLCQGAGSVTSWPLDPSSDSISILLQTEERHLTATVELTQGPNNKKITMDVYSSNGMKRPFFVTIDCPFDGATRMLRVINTGTLEYPISAWISPPSKHLNSNSL